MKCIYIEGKNVFANTNVEGVVNSKTDDCKIISYIESKYNIRYNSDCDTRFVQHHIYSFVKDGVEDFDFRLHIVFAYHLNL